MLAHFFLRLFVAYVLRHRRASQGWQPSLRCHVNKLHHFGPALRHDLLGRLSEGPCGEIDLGLIPGVGVGATVRKPSKLDLQVQVVNASTVSGG